MDYYKQAKAVLDEYHDKIEDTRWEGQDLARLKALGHGQGHSDVAHFARKLGDLFQWVTGDTIEHYL